MAWPIKPWKVMEEPQMPITEWKKTIGKGYIVYDLNCMALWKMQKNGDSKKEQWLPRIRAQGEMNRWNTQDMGVVKLFCMILQWWISVITHLSEPTGCTTARLNPDLDRGLWVTRTCQCRCISCNKCTTLVAGCWQQRRLCMQGPGTTLCSSLLWT